MALTLSDPRYWAPVAPIIEWLVKKAIKPKDRVLDVGPGHCPFPRADVAIDFLPSATLQEMWDERKIEFRPKQIATVNFAIGRMPFADHEFDFCFCRHAVEDMADPRPLLDEMQRVAKAGYIETPSPIVELTRGVDGCEGAYRFRGYHHHRFFAWTADGVLNLLSKYPVIEHLTFNDNALEEGLRRGPELWNNYYLWKDRINYKYWENPLNFDFRQYQPVLWQAALDSAKSTTSFCEMINADSARAHAA